MLATIFYLSTIIIIFYEMNWILRPIEMTKKVQEFIRISDENKGKKWDESASEYKTQIKKNIPRLYVLFWFMIGLFTFQWAVFLAVLLFNLLIIAPISKIVKFSFAYTVLHWFNSIIGLSFAIFTIINHYHLRIDMFQLFSSFFAK